MTVQQTERLIKALRANGITFYKDGDLEIHLAGSPLSNEPKAPVIEPPRPAQESPNTVAAVKRPTPPTAAAAPPVTEEIPHHVNEVVALLKLDDNTLAERMFPAGVEHDFEIPQFEGGQ